MAHYAKISDTNLVLSVVVVDDQDELLDGNVDEATAVNKLKEMFGWENWKKCSYFYLHAIFQTSCLSVQRHPLLSGIMSRHSLRVSSC